MIKICIELETDGTISVSTKNRWYTQIYRQDTVGYDNLFSSILS